MTIEGEGRWQEDEPIPLDHPHVPKPIAVAARQLMQSSDALHRVRTENGVEWWLLDSSGNLIEALWFD